MTPVLSINNLCISCDVCRLLCPESSVIKYGQKYTIESWSCTLCGVCKEVCPVNAIKLSHVEDYDDSEREV